MNHHHFPSKIVRLFFLPAIAFLISLNTASAAPILPGLNNNHPLNEQQIGALLINELRCAACHPSIATNQLPQKPAPDLTNVGARIAPDYLQRFIADPTTTQPGTTMPDVLTSIPPNKQQNIAQAITHFLASQSEQTFERQPINPQQIPKGRNLYHTIGCIACHPPRDTLENEIDTDASISLANTPSKFSSTSLSNFLFQPTATHPAGRMPDMNLTREEADSLANYLLVTSNNKTPTFKINPKLANLGKQYFQDYNCAACHSLNNIPPAQSTPSFTNLNPTRGCLAPSPNSAPNPAPNFNLTDNQINAIRKSLAQPPAELSDTDRINITLTAFNCIACHERDNFGGVPSKLTAYFQTSEPGLGAEARIPPPLTDIGAKLRLEWMQNVLFNSQTIRPHMHTRMPQFGEANLAFLPNLFTQTDTITPVEIPLPEGRAGKPIREAGQLMVGDKGLNCIACHNFNNIDSPGFKGLDLITSYERLTPSWFYHYMLNPGAFRHGIVMPNYWIDGKATRTDILDGNTDAQMQALWYYLSLGTSARTPSGMRAEGSRLIVTGTPRTYRGRSNVASYRGIAVGFPAKPANLNFAFNAQTGSLAALWTGDYVTVAWSSQGSGNFTPANRSIALPQDISFYQLPNDSAPWPLRPIVDKDNPENRDPLYPRNLGYAFKGYALDDNSNPTFIYHINNLQIQDQTIPAINTNSSILTRTFHFTSPTPQILHFRALVGTIQKLASNTYQTPHIRITTPPTQAILRPSITDNTSSELLIKLSIPKGESKVTIQYEILP